MINDVKITADLINKAGDKRNIFDLASVC